MFVKAQGAVIFTSWMWQRGSCSIHNPRRHKPVTAVYLHDFGGVLGVSDFVVFFFTGDLKHGKNHLNKTGILQELVVSFSIKLFYLCKHAHGFSSSDFMEAIRLIMSAVATKPSHEP